MRYGMSVIGKQHGSAFTSGLSKESDLWTHPSFFWQILWQKHHRWFSELQLKDRQKKKHLHFFTGELIWSSWKEYRKAELGPHVSFIKRSSLYLMRPCAPTQEFRDPHCWAIIDRLLKHAFFFSSIYMPDWEFHTPLICISSAGQYSNVK